MEINVCAAWRPNFPYQLWTQTDMRLYAFIVTTSIIHFYRLSSQTFHLILIPILVLTNPSHTAALTYSYIQLYTRTYKAYKAYKANRAYEATSPTQTGPNSGYKWYFRKCIVNNGIPFCKSHIIYTILQPNAHALV